MPRRTFLPVAVPVLLLGIAAAPRSAHARYAISADGPGGVPTYDLLGQAFTIETPDCGHPVPHITEAFDDELHENVFVFHLHVIVHLDDDRCGGKDRQRTEIRGGKLSQIFATNGETVYYHWKFRLPVGFQTSPNFTHIMQIKSDAAAPIMTLTPRGTDISIDGMVGVRGTTPLAPFLGTWVVADLKVLFGTAGHIDMTIKRISDGQLMFSHSGAADTWQGNAAGHDPKFGIYRSLNTLSALRDEDDIRFADFCFSKVSAAECAEGPVPFPTGDSGATEAPEGGAAEASAGAVEAGGGDLGGEDASAGSASGSGGSSGPTPTNPPSNSGPPPSAGPPAGATAPESGASGATGCNLGGSRGRATGGVLSSLLAAALIRRRRRSRRTARAVEGASV